MSREHPSPLLLQVAAREQHEREKAALLAEARAMGLLPRSFTPEDRIRMRNEILTQYAPTTEEDSDD